MLAESYTLQQKLGKGGFGVVHQAIDRIRGGDVAVKTIALKKLRKADTKAEQQLKREVELMQALRHPGMVSLIDVISETEELHLVIELCHGPALKQVLDCRGAFSEEEARGITIQLLQVVIYLHSNFVVHRDIKPGNILIVESLEAIEDDLIDVTVKVCDFGMGRQLLDPRSPKKKYYRTPAQDPWDESNKPLFLADELASPGEGGQSISTYVSRVGTRAYASPELILAQSDKVNMRIAHALSMDIYSTGQTLRHMLTGVCPDQDIQESAVNQDIVAMLLAPVRMTARCCCANSSLVRAGKRYRICEVSQLSPEAKDILTKMTAPFEISSLSLSGQKSTNRITVHQALMHAWITQDSEEEPHINEAEEKKGEKERLTQKKDEDEALMHAWITQEEPQINKAEEKKCEKERLTQKEDEDEALLQEVATEMSWWVLNYQWHDV